MRYIHYIGILTFAIFLFTACKKQDNFLEAKPNDSYAVPSTLNELQLLLNNEEIFNGFGDPAFGSVCSDEYYVLTPIWQSFFNPIAKNAYIWAPDIYEGNESITDWNKPYQQIYYANTVLDYIPRIDRNTQNKDQYDNLKGTALFVRAYSHYNLVQTFAMPYDSTTFTSTLGVPIKLSSDPNINPSRSSIKEVYDQVISDAKSSVRLLSVFPSKPTEPSRWAAYAFLARVHLAIREYKQAYNYADSCLNLKTTLTDYNTLTPNDFTISSGFLEEDIYHRSLVNYSLNSSPSRAIVDSLLVMHYEVNDLRLEKLFRKDNNNYIRYRGTYDFKNSLYSGLSVDEILLIRAESAVRLGKVSEGLKDVNYLLQYRYKKGTFSPLNIQQQSALLERILLERRKELPFRGLRWTDLRRLNLEDGHKSTLVRIINNTTYKLSPNDKKYALPIPPNEIKLTGMPQNNR